MYVRHLCSSLDWHSNDTQFQDIWTIIIIVTIDTQSTLNGHLSPSPATVTQESYNFNFCRHAIQCWFIHMSQSTKCCCFCCRVWIKVPQATVGQLSTNICRHAIEWSLIHMCMSQSAECQMNVDQDGDLVLFQCWQSTRCWLSVGCQVICWSRVHLLINTQPWMPLGTHDLSGLSWCAS